MSTRFFFLAVIVLAVAACTAQGARMTEQEILAGADARIQKYRTAEVTVKVVNKRGKPVKAAAVKVEQTNHSFYFGCNIFPMSRFSGKLGDAYGSEFAALFNYAILPFYWGAYERTDGKMDVDGIMPVAKWCREHNITTKGHPLVWHQVYPKWAPSGPDETKGRVKQRIDQTTAPFKGLVGWWDVVNEATVSDTFDNGVGHWIKRDGAAKVVGQCLDWAHAADPTAKLTYNDYNFSEEHKKLLQDLVDAKKPFDVIGLQSHMHRGEWPITKAWQVCEDYSKYGKPLHFTELTVLSGKLGWELPKPWESTPEGEAKQADYVEKFYTTLFSHPSVECIVWWDFCDGYGAWMDAPAGLVRSDFTPKPAYNRLMGLIKGKWWTKVDGKTDEKGVLDTRGFLGTYNVTITTDKGTKTVPFELKRGKNEWKVKL